MNALTTILPFLVAIFAGATAIVLFMGIFTMGAKEPTHRDYSNRLMQWRVGLQGVTLALIAVYVLVT